MHDRDHSLTAVVALHDAGHVTLRPAAEVARLLQKASAGTHECVMSVVNCGEIYYSVMRGASAEMAETKAKEIAAMPIELIPVGDDLQLVRQAAIFKAKQRISYAEHLRPRWRSFDGRNS